MNRTHLMSLAFAVACLSSLFGCGAGGPTVTVNAQQSIAHVRDAALVVEARNSSVEVFADAARSDVLIEARITAAGATREEAAHRAANTTIVAERNPEDMTLHVRVAFPAGSKAWVTQHDTTSFTISLPDVSGVTMDTRQSQLKVAGLAGALKLTTTRSSLRITTRSAAPVSILEPSPQP